MIPVNEKAPVIAEKFVLIDASPEKVWNLIADINKWPEWNPDIKKTEISGDLSPGTVFIWHNGGTKIRSTLHTVQPHETFGWSGKAFGAYAIHNWKVSELNGKTEVWVKESMEGTLMKIFRGFMQNTLENGITNWLLYLKEEAEKK